MPWGRLDDRFHRHRKVGDLSERTVDTALRMAAIGLWTLANSWSNAELADGRITIATVRMLGGTKEMADELARVGLWEHVSDGVWQVHDYGDYNRLKAQILADRADDAARQAAYRASHPDRPKRRHTVTPRVTPAVDKSGDNPAEGASQRDTERDSEGASQRDNPRDPRARVPSPVKPSTPVSPDPSSPPPPPASRGTRANGANPRAVGANPRATGDAPRQRGESPRQEREGAKRAPTALGEILLEATRRAAAKPNGHAPAGQGMLFGDGES